MVGRRSSAVEVAGVGEGPTRLLWPRLAGSMNCSRWLLLGDPGRRGPLLESQSAAGALPARVRALLPVRVRALLLGPPDVATPVLSWHRALLILSFTRYLVVGHLLKARGRTETGDAEMGNPGGVPAARM